MPHKFGYVARIKKKKPRLADTQKKAIYQWAKNTQNRLWRNGRIFFGLMKANSMF